MATIALLGYGRMGRAVEQAAQARGHIVSLRIDQDNRHELAQLRPDNTDVVIEFTQPDSFFPNLEAVLAQGVPMVSGTTGWHDRLAEARTRVAAAGGSLVYSSNFSVGVNLLFALNRRLATWMNDLPTYDCYVEEQHHRHKADAPSGTARTLADDIIARLDRKTRIAAAELMHRPPAPEELSVGFVRSGEIVGRHRVTYTSAIDSLSIEHVAQSREGFAQGAVLAAEWIADKQGCFDFAELFA